MRIIKLILSGIVTLLLLYALNRPWGDQVPMAIGEFVSPQHGFWMNAESSENDFGGELEGLPLKNSVEAFFDDRLVPHVFAKNDEDLYFVQGYLHARFRLFQMDLQTRAAAGRVSEVAGAKAVEFDRSQRRLGMVFAAENALKEIESDSISKKVFDAYTKGVNYYIDNLSEKEWPLEYKILNIKPDRWSNLRSALLLKMMAKMLAGGTENDIAYTNARTVFSDELFNRMYQVIPDSLYPIIPKGTAFATPKVNPVAPLDADSVYFKSPKPVKVLEKYQSNPNNGSNNWVVAGSKTKSGAPILTNDPHLELSLPSIWYEMQLSHENGMSYGVTLPGVPFIIIGFNNSIAWGITNSQRDVKDYYSIKFKDQTKAEYWYKNKWTPTVLKVEEIAVKGGVPVLDTVAYTEFGPVMYDASFLTSDSSCVNLAVRWVAHDPSNEAKTFYKLNRAKNYDEYALAIQTFDCPGQNFIFASKSGDIAIWQQGKFPARWQGQGLYVMPGEDDRYQWQGYIPQKENPNSKNPTRGFLQSANQRPVDGTYPYFIPGSYITPRGTSIDQKLANMTQITPMDMQKLLMNEDNVFARQMKPTLVKHMKAGHLTLVEKKYFDRFVNWDFAASATSEGQTIFQVWVDSLKTTVWNDYLEKVSPRALMPDDQVLLELMLRDSLSTFFDDQRTTKVETLKDVIVSAFKKAVPTIEKADLEQNLQWSRFKKPAIYHLLKEAVPSFAHTNLPLGGNNNVINAITKSHGPSWRMVVHMTNEIEAYGVYPAGQNGNPGSRFYDDFVDTWVKGELYPLWVMTDTQMNDSRVKWTLKLNP